MVCHCAATTDLLFILVYPPKKILDHSSSRGSNLASFRIVIENWPCWKERFWMDQGFSRLFQRRGNDRVCVCVFLCVYLWVCICECMCMCMGVFVYVCVWMRERMEDKSFHARIRFIFSPTLKSLIWKLFFSFPPKYSGNNDFWLSRGPYYKDDTILTCYSSAWKI